MKRLLLFLMLCVSYGLNAQNTTTLTGTITDSDGQVWANASWTAKMNYSGPPPVYISGGSAPTTFTGILTSGGAFSSASVGNNSQIVPPGSTWTFTVCSVTSAPCSIVGPLTVTGTTTNMGATLSPLVAAPRINGSTLVYAYNTTEIMNVSQGNGYVNTISAVPYLWNGSWTSFGGGGGGGGATLPFPCVVYGASASTGTCATAAQILASSGFTGAISNSYLTSSSTTVNGQSCPLGGSCSITAAPPTAINFYQAAVCDGGTSFAANFTRYDNQQPQSGCDATSTSVSAYLAFNYQPSLPQYAQMEIATPTYWTGTSAYVQFAGTATTGNVGWIIDTGCVNPGGVVSTVTFGTPQTVTTTVSSTSGALVTTAIFTNIGVPGTNGCVAGTTAPGSIFVVRIHRSLTDTQVGNANLYGAVLVTSRSQ